jgi:lysophospholipase L1-like esterase
VSVRYRRYAHNNVGANIGTDGVHPTVTGYSILASLWYNAITAHLAGK